MKDSIAGIIIVYRPSIEILKKTIESLYSQVGKIYLIDNTEHQASRSDIDLIIKKGMTYIPLHRNYGIAFAQNIGIKEAQKDGIKYVLISDQDTQYPEDYIVSMDKQIKTLEQNDIKYSVIGPNFIDANKNYTREGFVVFNNLFSRKIQPQTGLVEVSQLIASGSIIKLSVFSEVGFFDEALFIDWVDLEWCWRTLYYGYKIIGCADISIIHHLGDTAVKVGKKYYPIRSPIRSYYILRNAMYLLLYSKYINVAMRVNLFSKIGKYIIGFSILARPRGKQLYYSLRGLYDGLLKRMGPIR